MSNLDDMKEPKRKKLHKGVSVLIVVLIIITIILGILVAIVSFDKIMAARDYAAQTQAAQTLQSGHDS